MLSSPSLYIGLKLQVPAYYIWLLDLETHPSRGEWLWWWFFWQEMEEPRPLSFFFFFFIFLSQFQFPCLSSSFGIYFIKILMLQLLSDIVFVLPICCARNTSSSMCCSLDCLFMMYGSQILLRTDSNLMNFFCCT